MPHRRRRHLRPAGFDELGLRRALADRMLPFIVGAMAFLAALGLAGWAGAAALARHWQNGPAASLTIQVPDPGAGPAPTPIERTLNAVRGVPGVAEARILSSSELTKLLRPWLGDSSALPALPLPGVIAVRLDNPDASPAAMTAALARAAPGAAVQSDGIWAARLAELAESLQACAGAALLALAGVATAVIATATRAGIASRREAIEIIHGLGASDGYIAQRFARRATFLAAVGGGVGALAAAPVLIGLGRLAAPFLPDDFARVTGSLWIMLPALPLTAAAIGFITAQATVRRWLKRLP